MSRDGERRNMDNYQYEQVSTGEEEKEGEVSSRNLLIRQLLVASGAWTIYFTIGLCLGAPTVYIQQIRRQANNTDAVTPEMASWLSSIYGYASIPWVFIITAVSHTFGRKKAFMMVSVSTLVMFVCFYCSVTNTHLLITAVLQGNTHASSMTVVILVVAEYSSLKYRGSFLTIKTGSVFWGVWASNAIGTFFHWKNIPVLGVLCAIYSLNVFFWPESPYWLASKGRFDECKKAQRWLKGSGTVAEEELKNLVSGRIKISRFCAWTDIKKTEFYKPVLICCLMVTQYHMSGKYVCTIYVIDILKKITKSEGAAYSGMLILDGFTVFSMYVGSYLAKFLKRRTQLFIASSIGTTFLFVISLYLYLITIKVIVENSIVTIGLLAVFSIAMSCGPVIMAPSTFGEIIPTRFKNVCTILVSVLFVSLSSTILKLSPYFYTNYGLHGTFLFYAVSMVLLTGVLYKFMPETKDKTLQEIELYFKS